MGILATIIVGLIAGFLAHLIMKSRGGLLIDLILGVVGGFVGGLITSLFGMNLMSGVNITSILVALGGAIVVLVIYRLLFRRR